MNKYYLFISYSRTDSKAAAYLQRQLEHFRIPVKFVPEELRPDGQKFLRPVFRDKRDLKNTEGSFTDDIKVALAASRYLLVLCSPDSANSKWVNEEINYFVGIRNGDLSKVVPVILDGRPGEGGSMECLPPELRRPEITSRNLPTMIPDEGEPEKNGWENGVVQALSYMLKVDREKIKASVDREKLRQAKIYAVIGLCAAVVFAFLTAWAIHAERSATKNEQRAIAGEALAKKNETEAKHQADIAKKNEQRAIAGEALAKKNEAEAKRQADIAKKSLAFLGDMFRSADPTRRGSKDMKVLDAIRAKLPDIPKLKPWQVQASVSSDIAMILNNLGEFDTALQLVSEALNLYETHDPQSKDTATCYNTIGIVYCNQGKYDEALNSYKQALNIRLKVFGEYHSDTAISYNNIGTVYYHQGKYDEALNFYKQTLDIMLKVFGENHLNTASSYNNIGSVYSNLGKYDEALKFHQKTLNIRLKVLGENHPDSAISYNNIGSVYDSQGKYDEALNFYKQALNILLKVFGENHPDSATCYNNIGFVYSSQGKYDEALNSLQKALNIRLKVLGEIHPDTATCYNNIGIVYDRQGKYDEALNSYKQALNIRVKLGENHPDTATCYSNVAMMFWKKGDRKAAVGYAEKAVAIAEKVLGKNHPNTKLFAKGLAIVKQ